MMGAKGRSAQEKNAQDIYYKTMTIMVEDVQEKAM